MGLSESRVHKLCQQGRIPSLERFDRSWVIPEDAKKPEDPRNVKNIVGDTDKHSWAEETNARIITKGERNVDIII